MTDAETTAIWFDLDGTLVQFTEPYADVVGAVLEDHLGAAPDALVETYQDAFFDAFGVLAADPAHRGMAAALDAAGDAAPLDEPAVVHHADADPAAMVETLREREYAATAVADAARACVARLADDGPVGVLTNGWREWQVGKLEHHGLADHVGAVVASYEAGAHKPDPAPFELARERLPADRHVMVGDDDADVEGARAAGFVPVRYEDHDDGGPGFWETLEILL